jgi:hypothetical protein
MGKEEDPKNVTRREVLKLAGTAAAFCTSFGSLHAADGSGQVGEKAHKLEAKGQLFYKWQQAEFKWYKGSELLGVTPFPSKVLKHLQSDEAATVNLKIFRGGNMLRNLGTIESKF